MAHTNSDRRQKVIDIGKPVLHFTGGLEFASLTYTVTKKKKIEKKWRKQEVALLSRISGYAPKGCITAVMGPSGAGKSTFLDGLAGRIASGSLQGRVSMDEAEISPSLIKRTSAYIMQDDRLFPMLTVYETLMFAADFRLGAISMADKVKRVEKLIDQLGLSSCRNTYIGDEGTRGVSGGERRRVSIGVDIIHGPSLLFLDEPTSGLDSTSAHNVIEKVHHIARSGSTVILTIHLPSWRIQSLLDHLIILARGQLMYQGSPKDVTRHLSRMGRKVPKGENSIEHLIDPPALAEEDLSLSVSTIAPSPTPSRPGRHQAGGSQEKGKSRKPQTNAHDDYDHSLRSPYNSMSLASSDRGLVMQLLRLTPSRTSQKGPISRSSLSPGIYEYSSEILPRSPTPHSSDYTVNENDCLTPDNAPKNSMAHKHLGPKFANSFFSETLILMRRNFKNIHRTPELFLSRLVVLTIMGFMMATMFIKPKQDPQGITNRISFFIFTVCLFFFSSNDAVPAFIQERLIFVRESFHNAYRASSYTIASLITYLPFLALQAAVYTAIVWKALELRGPFLYFLIVLYVSLLSTNSFVVFVSSVVTNYILGYAAVIAFTALFFLFCGYFLNSHDILKYWEWMNTISTMTYPYEGLLINQYSTNRSFGTNPADGTDITGFQILKSLGINPGAGESKKWELVVMMLGWAVLYRILFYVILRFGSKNQRK
ncbi:hypothetical protein FH972_006831 [Carpinus fangiana]|uniref:ABC transporter G family member STR2 n=1 Tax=Carpinus fangiana TaxID=176857 RepID=A0A5N6QWG3_9ROSI|nr:hypothetical protein FH972_006831 [Carpinus fangiana]